jgi:adenylate kinase family enzyme
MKPSEFPLFKTKVDGLSRVFDLTDAGERKEYFRAKAGKEIDIIREYLADRTFVAYMIGKKSSGKGTYTKLLAEAVGLPEKIRHVSIGDTVRLASKILEEGGEERDQLVNFLSANYRGFQPLSEILKPFESRSTEKLMPTELVLALLKWIFHKGEKKTIFLDGFPRDLDQISYSLFFRDLIGYRDDQDLFVFIDLPEMVIDERMKTRVVCPKCQLPRSIQLLPTKEIGYDENNKSFYLKCDNQECGGVRMVAKEGDDKGIEPIRSRLIKDGEIIEKLLELEGVPKVLLRNSIPANEAPNYVDDYEITSAYKYEWDVQAKKVIQRQESWTVKDDSGVDSYSLLAPPVALSFIKQVADILKSLV